MAETKTPIQEKDNEQGRELAQKMGNLERETILKISEIARSYHVNPFEATNLFIKHVADITKAIMNTAIEHEAARRDAEQSEV